MLIKGINNSSIKIKIPCWILLPNKYLLEKQNNIQKINIVITTSPICNTFSNCKEMKINATHSIFLRVIFFALCFVSKNCIRKLLIKNACIKLQKIIKPCINILISIPCLSFDVTNNYELDLFSFTLNFSPKFHKSFFKFFLSISAKLYAISTFHNYA